MLYQAIDGLLEAGTVYHYRFVATNAAGTTNGPDHVFRTAGGTIYVNAAWAQLHR